MNKQKLAEEEAKEVERKYRNFPKHAIEDVLSLPQKIQDEMGAEANEEALTCGRARPIAKQQ